MQNPCETPPIFSCHPALCSDLFSAGSHQHGFSDVLFKEQDQENPEEPLCAQRVHKLDKDRQAPVLGHVGQCVHKHVNDLDHDVLHVPPDFGGVATIRLQGGKQGTARRSHQAAMRQALTRLEKAFRCAPKRVTKGVLTIEDQSVSRYSKSTEDVPMRGPQGARREPCRKEAHHLRQTRCSREKTAEANDGP